MAIGMSKSGLYAHFGSKQELQLATVEAADRIFQEVVVQPALAAPPGLARLVAVCDAYFDYLQRGTFPGGCFFAAAALEMGTRPGPVKERVAAWESGFAALVRGFVATALEQQELPAWEDPDRLAFELHGIMLAADTSFVLHDDPTVPDLARQIVRQRLGLGNGGNAGDGDVVAIPTSRSCPIRAEVRPSASPTRPLAPRPMTAVGCCYRSTPPLAAIDRQWQTRREAGTQSHGPHAGSRAAEQEVDLGGPETPACAADRPRGHDPGRGACRRAHRSGELPPLRDPRPPELIALLRRSHLIPAGSAPLAPRTRDDVPRAPSAARHAAR